MVNTREERINGDTKLNDKRKSVGLLVAIIATLLSLVGIHFVPDKRLVLVPSKSKSIYLATEKFPNGTAASFWLNDSHTAWQCNQPVDFAENYLPCSWRLDTAISSVKGMDLSSYDSMVIHMNYVGSANKIRIAIRNYNDNYSNLDDLNSTKFNAIQLHAKELNKPVH